MHKIQYTALNQPVLSLIPSSATAILDVGCGTGNLGIALKGQNLVRTVCGITYSNDESAIAEKCLDKVWIADINNEMPDMCMQFDCIIFSHVLEHTYQPQKILKGFSDFLTGDGLIIIALPNVLQYKQRLKFLKGSFRYSMEGGVMDITHFRFFDWETAQEMIEQAGLKIISKEADGNFPLSLIRKIIPAAFSQYLDRFFSKRWPGLFAFQFVFVANKKSGN